MTPRAKRFRLDELADDGASLEDQVDLLGLARTLEWVAADDDVIPHTGFSDRVMAAVATEPAPRPVVAAIGAARARRPLAALAALGDLWRVAWTGGRPLAVRAPAMVLVSLMLLGSIAVGALGAGATLSVLGLHGDEPSPVVSPGPSLGTSPLVVASPSDEVSESPSEVSESPSDEPSVSPDHSASASPSSEPSTEQGGGAPAPAPGDTPRPTPRPTRSPERTETPDPTQTPEPTDTFQGTPYPSSSASPTHHD